MEEDVERGELEVTILGWVVWQVDAEAVQQVAELAGGVTAAQPHELSVHPPPPPAHQALAYVSARLRHLLPVHLTVAWVGHLLAPNCTRHAQHEKAHEHCEHVLRTQQVPSRQCLQLTPAKVQSIAHGPLHQPWVPASPVHRVLKCMVEQHLRLARQLT